MGRFKVGSAPLPALVSSALKKHTCVSEEQGRSTNHCSLSAALDAHNSLLTITQARKKHGQHTSCQPRPRRDRQQSDLEPLAHQDRLQRHVRRRHRRRLPPLVRPPRRPALLHVRRQLELLWHRLPVPLELQLAQHLQRPQPPLEVLPLHHRLLFVLQQQQQQLVQRHLRQR